MKPPRNSKEVSKFLGMSQWYAKFIRNYADLCEPLYNLKGKLKKFCLSIEAQQAFDAVEAAITKVPVLKMLDFKKPFELFTDASSIGIGAVLNQEQRPVAFASRTLSNKDQGERHTGKTHKRGPLIRSPPNSWSEPSRKIKRRRKETIGYKRTRESGSGGPDRKIQNCSEHRIPKRALSSNYNTNDLPKFRKRRRTEETVMPSTRGYNLRPRNGRRVKSRSTIEMKTQQG
ncbi:retrovirus-related Pol polyprotein from transposon 297 [Trichonephila clavipes]|nr:retrovirus-related Pol polyprotein from transposon 297 [Trichonephila clavipes]